MNGKMEADEAMTFWIFFECEPFHPQAEQFYAICRRRKFTTGNKYWPWMRGVMTMAFDEQELIDEIKRQTANGADVQVIQMHPSYYEAFNKWMGSKPLDCGGLVADMPDVSYYLTEDGIHDVVVTEKVERFQFVGPGCKVTDHG